MIQIRLLNHLDIKTIDEALEHLLESRVKRIELIINEDLYLPNKEDFDSLVDKHKRISNILVCNSEKTDQDKDVLVSGGVPPGPRRGPGTWVNTRG